ncbi:MAG: ATP-binding protein [Muribaculaceae bacterium]|nr:ATP-binding protein [Muribaculaceae bacterium]
MRRLRIKNLGPIQDASLDLGQVNIIIGQQSSGKSCVLKTACYCAWVEKRIEITQCTAPFDDGSSFISIMSAYYNMSGYIKSDSYIEYETSHLKFSYDNSNKTFKMSWKSGRWNYKRPKVSYVPADRNLVAAIPGWSSLPLDENLLEFMSNWDKARKFIGKEENILGLGMSYIYDKQSNADKIQLKDGKPLMLKESSSGIQSLFPMFVHLDYMTNGQYEEENARFSYEQKEERKKILEILHDKFSKSMSSLPNSEKTMVDGVEFRFQNKKYADNFQRKYQQYSTVDHSEIFLEEPEDNLFPPTQCQLVNWLVEAIKKHDDILFVATHSPYILNQFIKDDPKGLTVFFTHRVNNDSQLYSVRQLNKEEIREIYDNGVDMFFNFEAYV